MTALIESEHLPVAAYFLAAAMSAFSAALMVKNRSGGAGRLFVFWTVLISLLVLLGSLKAAGIQPLVANSGREIAHTTGWYGERRVLQEATLALVFLMGLALWWVALRSLGPDRSAYSWPLSAAVFLCCFVLARGLSLHQVDAFLYRRTVVGIAWNGAIELSATLAVGLAALLTNARLRANELARRGDRRANGP